jgi:hypothetical protein
MFTQLVSSFGVRLQSPVITYKTYTLKRKKCLPYAEKKILLAGDQIYWEGSKLYKWLKLSDVQK